MTKQYRETVTEAVLRDRAREFAQKCLPGDIFLLQGDLGTGKSTFARYFIQSFVGETEAIPSPTFTLCQTYETSSGPLCHYDLYRLKSAEELEELGFYDHIAGHILLIEWPEKALTALKGRSWTRIQFNHISAAPETREMTVTKDGPND